MRTFPFQKYEGLGNDFIVVDLLTDELKQQENRVIADWQRTTTKLCHRRLGIGGDGILLILPSSHDGANAKMIVLNNDGSRPEMCGNGLRCVAHDLKARHFNDRNALRIETDAGIRHCQFEQFSESTAEIHVNMGSAQSHGEYESKHAPGRRFINVSMGNPHAVCFVDSTEDPQSLARSLGPLVEVDSGYPDRTNVEFAKCGDQHIELWVWERGCGITEACGTGACATAVAAMWTKRIQRERSHVIKLPGGQLKISFGSSSNLEVFMTGPSRKVFDGVLKI